MGSRAIVGGRDEVAFQRVQGARFLWDGRIVVTDAGSREVMVFDTAGTLVTRFGGRGQGPGELQSIVAVHVCGEDSIAVVDSRQTLHLFDGDGTFMHRARFRLGERSASLQGVSTNCRRGLLQQRTRQPPLDRLGLTEDIFAWVDSFSEAVDTVATAELLEAWTRSLDGAARPWVIPWGTSARTHATGNDQLVLGNGRVPELRRYDSTGELQLIVRWAIEPQPVAARDRRRYSEFRLEFLAWAPPNEPETRLLFPALDEYPQVPTHKPLFDRILLDDRGAIWARVFPESLSASSTRASRTPRSSRRPGRCSTRLESGWAISLCRSGLSSMAWAGIGFSAYRKTPSTRKRFRCCGSKPPGLADMD